MIYVTDGVAGESKTATIRKRYKERLDWAWDYSCATKNGTLHNLRKRFARKRLRPEWTSHVCYQIANQIDQVEVIDCVAEADEVSVVMLHSCG